MQIENSFAVSAPPDTVFAFLLDVNRIVSCVPGAELSAVVDPDTFRGKVRIKVGPVTVSYNGTAHITGRDQQARTATLEAEGRETTGSGSARATTTMSVTPDGEGSTVRLATDFTVVGRVAQFGRGIMEEVSRKLVGQMGDCIRTKLEAEESSAVSAARPPVNGGAPAAQEPQTGPAAARATARRTRASANPPEEQPAGEAGTAPTAEAVPGTEPEPPPANAPAPEVTPPVRVQVAAEPSEAAAPVDALALARSVAADRLRAVGPGRLVGIGVGVFAVYLLARQLRRGRHGE
jgi:carbon monoxide dehydrogenase subunit G